MTVTLIHKNRLCIIVICCYLFCLKKKKKRTISCPKQSVIFFYYKSIRLFDLHIFKRVSRPNCYYLRPPPLPPSTVSAQVVSIVIIGSYNGIDQMAIVTNCFSPVSQTRSQTIGLRRIYIIIRRKFSRKKKNRRQCGLYPSDRRQIAVLLEISSTV